MAAAKKVSSKKNVKHFTIDCHSPATDGIMNTEDFKRFMEQNIKVSGKRHNLEEVKISLDEDTNVLKLDTNVLIKKQYIKFLTKKYLCKNHLKDWIRVVSTSHDSDSYVLKYYKICNNDNRSDDEMSD